MEKELLQFRFQMGKMPLIYNDALVMTQEAYDALTSEQITALQKERYDRWYAIITAPPEPEPEVIPTEETI